MTKDSKILQCWERVRHKNESSFHVCVDCLVYLLNNETLVIGEEKIGDILLQRKKRGIQCGDCRLAEAF